MALVCDIKSDNPQPQQQEPLKEDMAAAPNEDLEDGEIEDDDEEETPEPIAPEPPTTPEAPPPQIQAPALAPAPNVKFSPNENKFGHNNRAIRFDRGERHNRYEERKRGHLTEAEKSVMHLHKLERIERLEREKRDRYKREQATAVDDFASNIEKAIASVLKKDKKGTDDEKEEDEKRGKKRKKKDKEKKKVKQRKVGSPKTEDYDENEMMNVRGGSPDGFKGLKDQTRSPSPHSDYDSYESSTSSDRSREDKKEKKKDQGKKGSRIKNRGRNDRKFRDRSREQKTEQFKDVQGVCLFYLQGKCNKGNDCPYSHEVTHPMKLELCKFYLMECCAKGDKCLYMHSEFPCKFYHTGLPCYAGDSCKFAHGKPLEDGLKQILFKHIETAPKEILGDFPRLSRDGALTMINQAQKALETKYGIEKNDPTNSEAMGDTSLIPSLFELNIPVPAELLQNDAKPKEKTDKPTGRERNRPSRWQDADPVDASLALQEQKQQQMQLTFGIKGFYSERGDQDMRVNSNGDIDMRTLLPPLSPLMQNVPQLGIENSPKVDIDQYIRDAGAKQDVDIRNRPQDTDIRQLTLDNQLDLAKDIDIRRIPLFDMQVKHADSTDNDDNDNAVDEPNLEIVMEDDSPDQKTDKDMESSKSDIDNRINEGKLASELPANLPKKQRELFLRIQAQQKENVPENQKDGSDDDRNNIDWYSDDDDDCRLTIKDDVEEIKPKTEETFEVEPLNPPQIPQIKPVEVIEKLGDLSKIDISAEVTKLLSSISQSGALKETKPVLKDPRTASLPTTEPAKPSTVPNDPRRARLGSTESRKTEKLSIYEQGSISIENAAKDVDLRNIERDLDMRPMFGDTDLRPAPGRPDIDLRQLSLPFKAMQNYTPASEIDASINSHTPIVWRVHLVDIPRPDYTGLKLSAHEAQNTGDPRLRKIFRLSTEEKESPASPKESPKAVTTGIRADPRRRKMEEKAADTNQMSYSQQLNMLQTSAFYQSLTSNQKVLLNQEVASKSDHSGSNDPTLNGILSNLGLIAGHSALVPNATANTSALNILATVNNLNPMMGQASGMMVSNAGMIGQNQNGPFVNQPVNPNILSQNPNIVNQMAQSIVQPGLLGAAPGVPNLPPDFQLNFDPRQGGLLGNAPFNYNDNSNFNYNEEYYDEANNFVEPPPSGGRGGGRGGRGGFRDRQQPRRGRNFNNSRSNGGRSFRSRNRTNRSRTPP